VEEFSLHTTPSLRATPPLPSSTASTEEGKFAYLRSSQRRSFNYFLDRLCG